MKNFFGVLSSGIGSVISPYTAVLKIAGIVAILSVVAGGLWYVSELKANLAISEMNNTTLTESVQTQKETIKFQAINYEAILNAQSELNRVSQKQRQKIKKLNDAFKIRTNGTSRNFGDIARAKPILIEHIVNKATKNVLRCVELATGATIKEKEVNNACPDLIK